MKAKLNNNVPQFCFLLQVDEQYLQQLDQQRYLDQYQDQLQINRFKPAAITEQR
jgi:predicted RNA-binding Zn ribbon-like protein